MKKREFIYIAVLTLLIAFMDITGIPGAFFVHIQVADIEPVYFTLMVNFLFIGNVIYLTSNNNVICCFRPDFLST